jgi:hypothetical protein
VGRRNYGHLTKAARPAPPPLAPFFSHSIIQIYVPTATGQPRLLHDCARCCRGPATPLTPPRWCPGSSTAPASTAPTSTPAPWLPRPPPPGHLGPPPPWDLPTLPPQADSSGPAASSGRHQPPPPDAIGRPPRALVRYSPPYHCK